MLVAYQVATKGFHVMAAVIPLAGSDFQKKQVFFVPLVFGS
jgi:hypothetical protein